MSLRWWDDNVVPRLVDASLKSKEIGVLRGEACAGLQGRVLEIGFGGGLNLRWLPSEVTAVTAIEPSEVGWDLSERRRTRYAVPVTRGGLDGQRLDQADDSHDSALITFSLCTIPDPVAALAEVRRVVRPGGRVHVLEHGLSPDPAVRRWQRRIDPFQGAVAGGCRLTRDIPDLLTLAGWRTETMDAFYLPGPRVSKPWLYAYLGHALLD